MALGFLCVDKPERKTSRGVTTSIHRLFRPDKVGHVGTLDPLATGVLVIAIGNATRLSARLHERQKEYVGRFQLGVTSETDDSTGDVRPTDAAPVTRADLEKHLDNFRGSIEQVPPKFSAMKVDGKRAYDLARAGREVDLKPRTVQVFELEIVDTPDDGPLSDYGLRIVCGSGTYIRSLGRDLAIAAGSSAVMTSLRRTRVGPFDLGQAVPLESITAETPLIDPIVAVDDLPKQVITDGQMFGVRCGNIIRCEPPAGVRQIALTTAAGNLVAVGECLSDGIQPRVVLPDAFEDAATV